MVQLALAFIAAAFVSVQASPLQKRIAQTVADSLVKWQDACMSASSNSLNCNQLAVTAFNTLLAAAPACAQQDSADDFIDFAKTLPASSDQKTMIALSQIFAQQPRNSPTSDSMPYCQVAPKNSELNGLYQCQWVDDNPTVFAPGVKVGAAGTIPLGMNSPLSPAGSCPAHPGGPIADGTQLVDITTIPIAGGGSGGGGGGGAATGPTAPATPSSTGMAPFPSGSASSAANRIVVGTSIPASAPPSSLAAATSMPASAPPSSLAAIVAENQKNAQQLNLQNADLTPDSPCTVGMEACINGDFAQCTAEGKYTLTACSPGLTCVVLPLQLKSGTSIACDTKADAIARGAIPAGSSDFKSTNQADVHAAALTSMSASTPSQACASG